MPRHLIEGGGVDVHSAIRQHDRGVHVQTAASPKFLERLESILGRVLTLQKRGRKPKLAKLRTLSKYVLCPRIPVVTTWQMNCSGDDVFMRGSDFPRLSRGPRRPQSQNG